MERDDRPERPLDEATPTRRLDFAVENPYAGGAAVGLLVLATDEVIEGELRRRLPPRLHLLHARLPNAVAVDRASLEAMREELPRTARLLPPVPELAVVAYCCTSGTTVIGERAVADAIRSVLPTVAVTDPLGAVKARLADLGARRLVLVTPYVPEVTGAMASHLDARGFRVTRIASFHEGDDRRVCRIAPASILAAIETVAAAGDHDAVFVACTNLRAESVLDEAARRVGKPVLSSNSALAWHIERLARERTAATEALAEEADRD